MIPPLLVNAFKKWGKNIAAVIVEPVVGNMGVVSPTPEFQKVLQRVPREQGALLIVDEVMTGFRLARGGAQELLGFGRTSRVLAKSSAGDSPWGLLAEPNGSWKSWRPWAPSIRPAHCRETPWPWRPGAATLSL
jgi:glutamate-1-semialdehyde 2,1-aminomutase